MGIATAQGLNYCQQSSSSYCLELEEYGQLSPASDRKSIKISGNGAAIITQQPNILQGEHLIIIKFPPKKTDDCKVLMGITVRNELSMT